MASLDTLQGKLGKRLAAHLLRRATYGTSSQDIESFANLTAKQAVEKLFVEEPLIFPDGPPKLSGSGGGLSKSGGRPIPGVFQNFCCVNQYTSGWRYYEMVHSNNARFKMINWFNTLFVIALRIDDPMVFQYWLLLEKMAFENIKDLAKKMCFDVAMLFYLNNDVNTKNAPNENYAREFLELFTILKGENIALGNYTNYTESDISLAARVFSGFYYTIDENHATDPETGIRRAFANFDNHSLGDKQFSAAFQNTIITGATDENDMYREVSDFVDMVFDQEETARAYVRKMYLFFVADKLNDEIESNVISPLAAELKENGYQHVPVLKKLLSSKHFYDKDDTNDKDNIIGGKIKPVWDLVFQSISIFGLENKSLGNIQQMFTRDPFAFAKLTDDMGLPIEGPNSVEGFPGFYKAPNYSRNWLSNNVLYSRFSMANVLITGNIENSSDNLPYQLDIVKWVNDTLDLPNGPGTPGNPIGASNAIYVVERMMDYLLPEKPTGERYNYFMGQLLGGLSPINWYFSWKGYKDGENELNVRVALERLLKALMSSPEYQTY